MAVGGVLRKLGFRWIFPIGTMPIPYHPLIGLAFAFGPILWVAWLALSAVLGADSGLAWWQPLMVALLLGIPLSIPFVAWGMVAFRAHLAQGMLIAGSMLLLAIDVIMERTAPLWALLPLGFVALYLVQRFGGKKALAELQRGAAEWETIDLGDRTLIVPAEAETGARASIFIQRCDVARVLSLPGAAGRQGQPRRVMIHRLSDAGMARLRDACEGAAPEGWWWPRDGKAPTLQRPVDAEEELDLDDALTVSCGRYEVPMRLVTGQMGRIRVSGADGNRTVVWGRAQIVGRLPVFTFFHWTAILGGRSEWHVGFVRDRPVALGPEWSNEYAMPPQAFTRRPADGGRNDDAALFAEDGPVTAAMIAAAATERERVAAFWREIADNPLGDPDSFASRRLGSSNALFRPGDGLRLVAWLKAAREGRHLRNVRRAAALLEALPEEEFAATGPALFDIVNSRVLAGEWELRPGLDLTKVPKDCPRFGKVGGYGLALYEPRLYTRYARLGPEEAALVKALGDSLDGHHFMK